jgi:alpha-L-rhamnosidase
MGLYEIEGDHGQTALDILTSCDENSWCHMLSVNATATMEAWTRNEKPNLSWSHPWATAAATAIVRGFIGLTALEPAFKTYQIKPQPGNAAWGQIRVPAAVGFFDIDFNQTAALGATAVAGAGRSFVLTVAPPANTVGRACLPKLGRDAATLEVDGASVSGTVEGDYVCLGGLAPKKGQAQIKIARVG